MLRTGCRVFAIAVTLLASTFSVASAQEVIVYYHTDAIGSVRMITDESGSVIANYHFLPFGEAFPVDPQAPADTRMFTGAERDPETSFDYLGARYYQSQTGRFTRPDDPGYGDPFNPQSMNLYAYAYNNPLRYIDPTGHSGDCVSGYDAKTGTCEPVLDPGTSRFFWDSWKSFNSQITSAMQRLEARHPEIDQYPVLGTSPFMPHVGRLAGLIGRSFGVTGRIVANPGISIRGFQGSVVPGHAINQIINRGVSPQLLKSIVGNPTVVLEQAGGRYLYLTGEGAVVMTREGQVVTAYTVREFLPHIWQVLKTVAGQ